MSSSKEKFDILNFINGYIISICGNYHKKNRNLLKDFSIKFSSSAKSCIGFFGINNKSNIGPISSSAKSQLGFFEVSMDSIVGPVSSSAVGLLENLAIEE